MTKNNHRILIVDDEEDICEILQFNLEGEGYDIETANSAEEALEMNLESFSLILLDVMMEEISGFKLAKIIRKDMELLIPIIFITAKNTENDLLTGFNIGGDDFIPKPFSIKEVIVRVKAALSRVPKQNIQNEDSSIVIDDLELNFEKRNMSIMGEEIQLTKKEFNILSLLLKSQGRVFSREEIITKVWEEGAVVTNRTIDVHVTRLRKKAGKYGQYIVSKSGYGYAFSMH